MAQSRPLLPKTATELYGSDVMVSVGASSRGTTNSSRRVRRYREDRLAGTGLAPVFPLWGKPTPALAEEMIDGGLRAVLTCINPKHLDRSFAGREFDRALLRDLPAGIDPCGEYGEFHSFAYEGPMFDRPISALAGEIVNRGGFVFADVC